MKVLVVRSALAIVFAAIFMFATSQAALAQDDWMAGQNIRFELQEDYGLGYTLPKVHFHGNEPCTNQRVMTKMPYYPLGYLVPQPPEYADVCAVNIHGGYIATTGYGSGAVFGTFKLIANNYSLIPHPKMESWLIADRTNSPAGSVYLRYSGWGTPELSVGSKGQISYEVKSSLLETKKVLKKDGSKLLMRSETARFSSNGEWIVFDSPGYGIVRMNIATKDYTVFGDTRKYGQGFNPAPNLGVSADGRYVVVNYQSGSSKVYDTENCTDIESGSLSHQYSCAIRDIEKDRTSQTGFGKIMRQINFTSATEFTYLTLEVGESGVNWRKYSVSLGEPSDFSYEYLGLGDSFASGEGAYAYKPITNNDDNRCHVSPLAYPFAIGEKLNLESYESIACSGAVMGDVFARSEDYNGQYNKNLSELDKLINFNNSSFIPGEISQLTYLNRINPRAVTISVGGNDIGFSKIIKHCVLGSFNAQEAPYYYDSTCYDSLLDRASLAMTIQETSKGLEDTFTKLKENNRQVYVLGYPSIVASGGDCAVNVRLDNSETDFAHKLVALLNDAVEVAAKRAGVVYVDVEDIFNGKRLCETDSKSTLVHGLTEEHRKYLGFITGTGVAVESFHPKAMAADEYAAAVLAQTENLTKSMPIPDYTATLDIFSQSYWSSYWNIANANPIVDIKKPIDLTIDNMVEAGQNIQTIIPTTQFNLTPGSMARVELHSDPYVLGEFEVDEDGDLNLDINIPNDVPPGMHMLKIFTKNKYGQPLEIFDNLLVAHSYEDFDGDGVLNEDEACVLVQPSGTDSDGDGQDDACDGTEPAQTEPPVDTGTVPLPDFDATGQEKNINSSPETVAGNEEMNPVVDEQAQTSAQANTQPEQPAPSNTRRVANIEDDTQTQPADTPTNESQVLGTDNSEAPSPVTIPSSSKTDTPDISQQKTSPVLLWSIVVSATVLFVGLVVFLLIARRR